MQSFRISIIIYFHFLIPAFVSFDLEALNEEGAFALLLSPAPRGGELLTIRVLPNTIVGIYRGIVPAISLTTLLPDCAMPTLSAVIVGTDSDALSFPGFAVPLPLNAVVLTFSERVVGSNSSSAPLAVDFALEVRVAGASTGLLAAITEVVHCTDDKAPTVRLPHLKGA